MSDITNPEVGTTADAARSGGARQRSRFRAQPEETAAMLALKSDGLPYREIAERFGRTPWGVRAHLARAQRTDEERREMEKARTARRQINREQLRCRRDAGDLPDAEAPSRAQLQARISERDRRQTIAPRDLTAELMGDPLPGHSALEQPRSAPRIRSVAVRIPAIVSDPGLLSSRSVACVSPETSACNLEATSADTDRIPPD